MHFLAFSLLVALTAARVNCATVRHDQRNQELWNPAEFNLEPIEDPEDAVANNDEMGISNDNYEQLRRLALNFIMEKVLEALGPEFEMSLPKAPPTNNALPEFNDQMFIMADQKCSDVYERCSSQTFFPSCDVPFKTDPEAWRQRFNLFFDIPATSKKSDIINATLRVYKNLSLPLEVPETLLIEVFAYSKTLTQNREKKESVAVKEVPSDYVGWISINLADYMKTVRPKHNHGLLVTVRDLKGIEWNAPELFASMDCSERQQNVAPLPFEVVTDSKGPQYPALNIHYGFKDDKSKPAVPLWGHVSHRRRKPRQRNPADIASNEEENEDDFDYVTESSDMFADGPTNYDDYPDLYGTDAAADMHRPSYDLDMEDATNKPHSHSFHQLILPRKHHSRGSEYKKGLDHLSSHRKRPPLTQGTIRSTHKIHDPSLSSNQWEFKPFRHRSSHKMSRYQQKRYRTKY